MDAEAWFKVFLQIWPSTWSGIIHCFFRAFTMLTLTDKILIVEGDKLLRLNHET